jgi:hypothetical protein
MANGFYQKGMKHIAFGDVIWKAAGGSNIRATLGDAADYTVDLAAHEFVSSVAAAAQEEISGNMTLIDAADNGVLDANDVTFVATAGDQCEFIMLKRFVTNDADSLLLLYIDTAGGLPVTLGGDVTVAWDNGASKIAVI